MTDRFEKNVAAVNGDTDARPLPLKFLGRHDSSLFIFGNTR